MSTTQIFSLADASRMIEVINQRIDKLTKSYAKVETTWGKIESVSTNGMMASAYLYGETNATYSSDGFRVPNSLMVAAGDVVKVAMDSRTGDRWVDEITHPNDYAKMSFDIVRGTVYFGDGSTTSKEMRFARTAQRQLTIDDNASSTNAIDLYIQGTLTIRTDRASGHALLLSNTPSQTANMPFRLGVLGQMHWGSGAATRTFFVERVDDYQFRFASSSQATVWQFEQTEGYMLTGLGFKDKGARRTTLWQGDINGANTFSLVTYTGNAGAETSTPRFEIDATTGIFTIYSATPLHLTNTTDVSLAGDRNTALQIGDTASTNLVFDNTEIEARNNGAAAALTLQNDGGVVRFGYTVNATDGTGSAIELGQDTNLYRSGVNIIATDDRLYLNNSNAITAGTITIGLKGNSHTGDFTMALFENATYGGVIQWGLGDASGNRDVQMYRIAADRLYTPDMFSANDGISTKVVAGVVSDASFTATPVSGTIAVDTTNSQLYVRVGSTWKKVAVA